MPDNNADNLARKIISGDASPADAGFDASWAGELKTISEAGYDPATLLSASLASYQPALCLRLLASLVSHDRARELFSEPNLGPLSLLCSGSPWALEAVRPRLLEMMCMKPVHFLFGQLENVSPESLSEATAIRAGTPADWRAVLFARAALFDLCDEGDPWEALQGYSTAAEALIRMAYAQALDESDRKHGVARGPDGEPCAFVVMGMGNLGGGELNASSDIDIVYFYESDEGACPDGLSIPEWASALSRRITDLLGSDGAGLRVDLRLRPGGQFGPVACSMHAAEIHYESFGQAWERQMLIRARPVAGSMELGRSLIESVRPFVYRRRMDPTALKEIRRIKSRLDAEVLVAAGGDENVKLSRGGIRELEYVVQTYQLLFGGKFPAVRTPSLRAALDTIGESELLPAEDVATLRDTYLFLRRLENRIQLFDGRQNHRLPQEPAVLNGLARSMTFSDPREMLLNYNSRRRRIENIFNALFEGSEHPSEEIETVEPKATGVFFIRTLKSVTQAKLASTGIPDPAEAFEIFSRIASRPEVRSEKGLIPKIEAFAPKITRLAAKVPDPMGALSGFERFTSRQNALATLFSMIEEDGRMAEVLVRLLGRGAYLSDLLIANPEAFVPLFVAQDVSGGASAVENSLLEIARIENDEQALRELRKQKTIFELQIALEEIYRPDDPETAWALNAGLARGCVKAVCEIVRRSRTADRDALGVCLLGSAGNGEPVMNSDLDLLFLHDGHPRPEELTRMVQAVLKELERPTPEGILFRTDLRLRPYGQQGVLVASLNAAKDFYRKSAPVTTRLSLLRTHALLGKPAEGFAASLPETLFTPALSNADRTELADIRRKVVQQVPADRLDVKSSPGTLSDIEFIVGSLQLTHGASDAGVRVRNTCAAVAALREADRIDGKSAADLLAALRWFKRLESALRTLFPRPVSLLPSKPAELAVLARMMDLRTAEEMISAFREQQQSILKLPFFE